MIFELILIAITAGLWYYMHKQKEKHIWQKLLILFIGVFLFEIMSEPMWRNYGLSAWTYIYHDVSWVITLGWTNIFMITILLVDRFWKKYEEKRKFWFYLLVLTVITTPIEVILLSTGLRGYDPVLTSTMSGVVIPFTAAPIEIIFVVPIIGALVIPFYKTMTKMFIK